jgi:hypothetical protein
VTVVALGESIAQAWREGKESRGRASAGRRGSSLFIVANRGGGWVGVANVAYGRGIAGVNAMK